MTEKKNRETEKINDGQPTQPLRAGELVELCSDELGAVSGGYGYARRSRRGRGPGRTAN